MKLYWYLLLAFCLATTTLLAQTAVPNGGFENWTNAGGSSEEPTSWNSNKTGGGNASAAPQTCFREGNPHSGTYCLRIKATTYFGVTVNGICATGRVEAPSFSSSDGYVGTVTSNANFNSPFTGRPDSLVGWYKFTSAGSNPGTVQVNLHTGAGALPESGTYQGNTTPNVVGRAVFNTPTSTVSGWTRFSVPFVYVNNSTPAYFLAVINTGATNNNVLYIDDLEAIYNPALATSTVATGPYYVSGTTGASISVPFTATGTFTAGNTFTAQLSNASGSFASPVTIGTLSGTASGSINATLPAGTASGAGYRIRVVSSTPNLTAANNGADITINLVSTSIAPATAQTLAINTPGALLTVTETAGAVSREWRYATASGGPYTAFSPAATGTTFAPQFAAAGTYYVVALTTYPGGFVTRSNEVTVTVVGNTIAPASSQSLLVGATGTLLTVTETPTGTSREWKYATAPGGPYLSFSPAETNSTFAPVFNTGGTFYVVAQSIINGQTVTSNEVEISVNNINLNTGTITPSAFYFSPSAPSAQVSIPFTTTSSYVNGNVFTAQLSDANGNFSTPVNIGSLAGTGSGTITGTLLSSTTAGTGYRIRVVASNPAVNGSNNGTDLLVDQFNNSIAPAAPQSYTTGSTGTLLSIVESQPASREWKYATVPGGPYVSFSPPQTGATFTPAFTALGTYYVVATSQNQYSDLTTSSEVAITVENGTTLTTAAVSGSPFLVSPSSNVQVQVAFASNILYGAGNTFTAELSDANGDFTNPVAIGTTSSGNTISAVIPSNSLAGTGYRIRVVASNPATVGTDNGTDLAVVPFEIAVTPMDSQQLVQNASGNTITITETHPATREWLASGTAGFGYGSFTPAETGTTFTPNFAFTGTKYVVVRSINQWGDTLTSSEIVVVVTPFVASSVDGLDKSTLKAYWNNSQLVIDLTNAALENPMAKLFDISGKLVSETALNNHSLNQIDTTLSKGIYILQLTSKSESFTVKTVKP